MFEPLFRGVLFGLSIGLSMIIYRGRTDAHVHVLVSSLLLLMSSLLMLAYHLLDYMYRLFTSRRLLLDRNYRDLEFSHESTANDTVALSITNDNEHESLGDKNRDNGHANDSTSSTTATSKTKTSEQQDTVETGERIETLQPAHTSNVADRAPTTPPPPLHQRVINVWTDVYGFGSSAFVIFYCMDMVTLLPSQMFLLGIFLCSVYDLCCTIDDQTGITEYIGIKRSLTIAIHLFMGVAWVCMTCGILQMQPLAFIDAFGGESLLNILLSYVFPTLAPILVKCAARANPDLHSYAATRRIITNAYPFMVFTAAWYLLCYLAYSSDLRVLSLFLSNKFLPVTVLLMLIKCAACVGLLSAFLSNKITDVLVNLGLILFAKEFAFGKHTKTGDLVLPALVLAAISTVLMLIRYCPPALRGIAFGKAYVTRSVT